MIVKTMGAEIKEQAKTEFATAGIELGTGVIGAVGDLLGGEIRGLGSKQDRNEAIYGPAGGGTVLVKAGPSPLVIGGLVVGGVLVVALVVSATSKSAPAVVAPAAAPAPAPSAATA